jgi:hypothetical protein
MRPNATNIGGLVRHQTADALGQPAKHRVRARLLIEIRGASGFGK